MMRCDACKHWKTARVRIVTQAWADKQTHPDGRCSWTVGHSAPEAATQIDNVHQWGECCREAEPGALASATCEREGIGGELMTAAEFGCVQFEAGTETDHVSYYTFE